MDWHKLVTDNMRYAHWWTWRYYNAYPLILRDRGLTLDDIFICVLWGMCIAAKKFDPQRGIKFESYAQYYVKYKVVSCLFYSSGRQGLKIARYLSIHGGLSALLRRIDSGDSTNKKDVYVYNMLNNQDVGVDEIGHVDDNDTAIDAGKIKKVLTRFVDRGIIEREDAEIFLKVHYDGVGKSEVASKHNKPVRTIESKCAAVLKILRGALCCD